MSAYNARMVASMEQTTFMRVVAAETPGHLQYLLYIQCSSDRGHDEAKEEVENTKFRAKAGGHVT